MLQIVQFLWTKFSMQDWSLSALLFVCTLWTGYCELPDSAVALWTGYWVTHWELLWIKFNCVVRSRAAHNTTRVFEQWSIFNPAFAVRNATAQVRLQCCLFLTDSNTVWPLGDSYRNLYILSGGFFLLRPYCPDDDDCFYYHSWRNNVVIAFGTLSSFLT